MNPAYHIDVFWSGEDGEWIADIPDLETCSVSGDTPEEAVREVQVALELWLDEARQAGRSIPRPRAYRTATASG